MQSTEREAQAGRGEVDSGARDIHDIQVQGARPQDREALVFVGATFSTAAPAARTRRPESKKTHQVSKETYPVAPAASDSQWNSVLAEAQGGAQEGGGASGK